MNDSLHKMKYIFSIFVLFLIFNKTLANVPKGDLQDDYIEYNENVYRKIVKMDQQLKQFADQSVKRMLPFLLEAREHVNISTTCSRNLFELLTGFRKLTGWSFNFLDSIGKIQSGIKAGNVQMFGEFKECMETSVMKKGKLDFQGKYCVAKCKPYLPKIKKTPNYYQPLEGLVNATRNASDFTKFFVERVQAFYVVDVHVGLCIPSGCSKQDLSEIMNYSIAEYINCTVSHCVKDGDLHYWDTRRIIFVSIFVLLLTIVVLSTWFDYTLEKWKNNTLGFKSRLLQCFSLMKNFPKLMNTHRSPKSIKCLDGIRVLTIFWVILGHEYFIHAFKKTSNHIVNAEGMLTNFFSQILFNGFLTVDIFFFLSGFLNCYIRMIIKQDGYEPGPLTIFIHRLWRIYPSYFIGILLMYLMSNPQPMSYPLDELMLGNCNKYWWQNILFISNLFDLEKMCFPQSWFLCVDTQLFLLSLFTIPFLFRKPTAGIILHIGIILVTNLCSMTWWFVNDFPPATIDVTRLDEKQQMQRYYIYIQAPVHVGSYVIGILLGYLIATKRKIKIPNITQFFGWIAASLLFCSMLFMTLRWNSGIQATMLEGALYGAWSNTIAVLGFSWLVFCCANGHSRLINYILSFNLWIPLSRITYMIYLVSPSVQGHRALLQSFPLDFAVINIIWGYFGNMSISILLSFVLVLLIESPFIAMEKLIFKRNKDENKAPTEVPKEIISSDVKEKGFQENGKITTIHL